MKPPFDRALTLQELANLPDDQIDLSDIPERDDAFWARAKAVMPQDRNMTQITAKFDRDVVDWFRRQGRGYQARMNAVLRSYVEAHKD